MKDGETRVIRYRDASPRWRMQMFSAKLYGGKATEAARERPLACEDQMCLGAAVFGSAQRLFPQCSAISRTSSPRVGVAHGGS